MTEREIHSSPRFVDFGYEPGTLVLGGMWLNRQILDLCVHHSLQGERSKIYYVNQELLYFYFHNHSDRISSFNHHNHNVSDRISSFHRRNYNVSDRNSYFNHHNHNVSNRNLSFNHHNCNVRLPYNFCGFDDESFAEQNIMLCF
ncbi:hypothetical protein IQ244_16005 [Nostoc sp. LEGE 06077]|uniref:hypothetical protein n=1 Tax=Nostoc sp. LEGE 06077 TaxID=915325 RepID=UPI00187F7D9C|nr:hypothetical protein [Nostoc sp. LEGE 06077]MBE9208001.1 hypothetical protein [Nostoc sp. LEGE 06077]